MPHIPYHPAPGFGDLLPGSFVVPQNPIQGANTPLVPSVQAASGGQVTYRPKMGDLLPGMFTVPQNPIRTTMATGTLAGLSCGGGCSGGCGCGSGGNFYGMSGLSGLGDGSILDWAQAASPVASLPNWMLYGGGAFLAYMLLTPGGSEYRSKARALRSEYRGYRRVGRRAGELAA